jgi:hypothetical protein
VTTYVYRDGKIVERPKNHGGFLASEFPAPRVSRFEAYQSPIDDRWITSDRQRERDLHHNDAYDRRDTPKEFLAARRQREADHGRQSTEPDAVRATTDP